MRTIQQHHQHIGHYHIAGNPGRRDPDASQELNYPAILQTIADAGYGGYVGMEYIPVGNPVESLRHAMALLR